MKAFPTFDIEKLYWERNVHVIGVDEVGRGALAGDVYVAGVCIDSHTDKEWWHHAQVNDSKKLSPTKREVLAKQIPEYVRAFSIASSTVACINSEGIVKAIERAMREVIQDIRSTLPCNEPVFVLIDGFKVKHIIGIGLQNQLGIVRGDALSFSIAAASIIAKVARDTYMGELGNRFSAYVWDKNKGYGTADHLRAIKEVGITDYHRTLFVRNILT